MTEEEAISRAEVRQIHGLTMAGRGQSNHWVVMDGPVKFQGAEAGTRPMELVLISLAGCTGMDVISLLQKMRVRYNDLKIDVEAKRAEEHPKVYTEIVLHYHFYGKDPPMDKLEKAVDKSQNKYCSVTAMLAKTAKISYDIQVHENEE